MTSIAVCAKKYLNPSETFIHRQIVGVEENGFSPVVVANSTANIDKFPYSPLVTHRPSLLDRAYSKAVRELGGFSAASSRWRYYRWREILTCHRVRLVHAHFGWCGLELLRPCQSIGVPLVVTFHGSDASTSLRDKGYVRSLQKLFEYAGVLAVSNAIAYRLRRIGGRVRVIHIGCPLERFRYHQRTPIRTKVARGERIELLQVARLVEKKGTVYTLEAFEQFVRDYPAARLTIAGDGPLRAELRKTAERLRISDSVRFIGVVSEGEVASLMADADAFLLHSVTTGDGDQEGTPIVLAEAMATGLPVVSTYHSGIPELVNDGTNGYLVQERDVGGYRDRLVGLLGIGSEIGRAAHSTVARRFDAAVQNRKLADYYREVLNSAGSAGSLTTSASSRGGWSN